MTVFQDYARYYDLFYKDKDYKAEAAYVAGILERSSKGLETILNLGCGTGNHDLAFARSGYRVTGIDQSARSIDTARTKAADLKASGAVEFHRAEIRSLDLGRRFDAAVSLFHVMSYLTTDDDLQSAFDAVGRHLETGGIFLFDCWYGPAVLTDPPTVRVKRVETDEADVVRVAEPDLRVNENRVDVHYQVLICQKDSGKMMEVREVHPMRYWFVPEITRMLGMAGFNLLECYQWMTGRQPDARSWNVCFVGKKRGQGAR